MIDTYSDISKIAKMEPIHTLEVLKSPLRTNTTVRPRHAPRQKPVQNGSTVIASSLAFVCSICSKGRPT